MVTNNALTLSMVLSILLISFLIHGVERQMRYQHDALKGYYLLGRLMLFLWLPFYCVFHFGLDISTSEITTIVL